MKLAVVGLGKLGCPMAALLAAAGNEVVGADLDPRVVDALNAGAAPVQEPGLDELIAEAGGRLLATTSVEEAVEGAEVAFCIVPTPSRAEGSFETRYAEEAFEAIGRGFARSRRGRQVAVLTSTVLPGDTEGRIRPALERGYGRPSGTDLEVCYSPEFIALGSVIADMRQPDMVLIGASADWAADLALSALTSVVTNGSPVARMSIVNAEITKLAVNTFVTTKISYANMLAEVCAGLPGADAEVVTRAIGLDSRIGHRYLRPGAAYGGPCFPRDNAAFAFLAETVGASADLAVATDAINRRQACSLAERVAHQAAPGASVAVLGLSYKPSTPVTEESFGVASARELVRHGFRVRVYDPLARVALPGTTLASSADEAVAGADVVVVATAWPEFSRIRRLSATLVFDFWRQVPRTAIPPGARVFYPGRSADDAPVRAGAVGRELLQRPA